MANAPITFHVIEDAVVILRSKGVYKQAKVYERGGYLYAGYGSGFIRMGANGTGLPNVSVDAFELPYTPATTVFGYYVKPGHPDTKKG